MTMVLILFVVGLLLVAVEIIVPGGLLGIVAPAHRDGTARGRLGLILGQAGNRDDADIRDLAGVAADHRPDLVLLKDIDGYMRGRAAGEVATVIADELQRRGLPPSAIRPCGRPSRLAGFKAIARNSPGKSIVPA